MSVVKIEQKLWERSLGAVALEDGSTQFRLWAPKCDAVKLHIVEPEDRLINMLPEDDGYFQVVVDDIEPGATYFYHMDGEDCPDPASLCQPDDVHGASRVIPPEFPWEDADWKGIPLNEYIIYELHVGTFTQDGTFEAIIPHLDALKSLGITVLELMPIGQFPGKRNWGYDGVYPFAPQASYGDSDGLRRLVNACHMRGLAVVLDVVYNHFGPEGNYTEAYADYFTEVYKSAWGKAINFDQELSDEVRRFFIENALHWLVEFHIDSLRLDATHTIMDFSAYTFLEELAENVHRVASQLQRKAYLIAESAKNDVWVTRTLKEGGLGMDAQWNDDFHHALRTLLTGDQTGYYQDYGGIAQLAKAYREGFYFSGQYSKHLKRRFGTSSADTPAERLVIYTTNHDQVGNRAFGERLSEYVTFDALKLAAAVTMFSPYLPLIFMGEEYDEDAPFLYFIDFNAEDVVEGVREGRKEEFAPFLDGEEEIPDPEAEETFQKSKLNYGLSQQGHHRVLWRFYQRVIELRKTVPALANLSKEHMEVTVDEQASVMIVRRWHGDSAALAFYNFNAEPVELQLPEGEWRVRLDSGAAAWGEDSDGRDETDEDKVVDDGQMTLAAKSALLLEAAR
jgi:maltooligosyltrehalose trehalohydrolase